jgi:hypothetical protein
MEKSIYPNRIVPRYRWRIVVAASLIVRATIFFVVESQATFIPNDPDNPGVRLSLKVTAKSWKKKPFDVRGALIQHLSIVGISVVSEEEKPDALLEVVYSEEKGERHQSFDPSRREFTDIGYGTKIRCVVILTEPGGTFLNALFFLDELSVRTSPLVPKNTDLYADAVENFKDSLHFKYLPRLLRAIMRDSRKGTVDVLILALKDKNRMTRSVAAKAIGDITADLLQVEDALFTALRDKELEVRWNACESLKAAGFRLDSSLRGGEDIFNFLFAAKDWDALGYLNGIQSIKKLETALDQFGSNAEVTSGLVRALALHENESSLDVLLKHIESRELKEEDVIEAFFAIGSPALRPLIVHLTNVSSTRRQEFAAKVLVKIGEPAIQDLLDAMNVGVSSARLRIVEVLKEIGYPARHALQEIVDRYSNSPESKRAGEALTDLGQ